RTYGAIRHPQRRGARAGLGLGLSSVPLRGASLLAILRIAFRLRDCTGHSLLRKARKTIPPKNHPRVQVWVGIVLSLRPCAFIPGPVTRRLPKGNGTEGKNRHTPGVSPPEPMKGYQSNNRLFTIDGVVGV